jgi:cytochrome c oxidase assembly protein Cox11
MLINQGSIRNRNVIIVIDLLIIVIIFLLLTYSNLDIYKPFIGNNNIQGKISSICQ